MDSAFLLKQMLNYFTKLLIIHSKLGENKQFELLFNRLKQLDVQMAEVCRTILEREYPHITAQSQEPSSEQAEDEEEEESSSENGKGGKYKKEAA